VDAVFRQSVEALYTFPNEAVGCALVMHSVPLGNSLYLHDQRNLHLQISIGTRAEGNNFGFAGLHLQMRLLSCFVMGIVQLAQHRQKW
jgi:hypothetical protein